MVAARDDATRRTWPRSRRGGGCGTDCENGQTYRMERIAVQSSTRKFPKKTLWEVEEDDSFSARRRRLTCDKESNRWPYCCEVWTKYCSRGALWAGGVTGPCRGGLDKGGPSWGCGGSWPGVRRIPIPARHVSSGPGVSMGRVQGAVGVRGVGGDEMRPLEPASRR